MKFTDWILLQKGNENAIGDLARDIDEDVSWPKNAQHLSEYQAHLENANACQGAKDALIKAYTSWKKEELKNKRKPRWWK